MTAMTAITAPPFFCCCVSFSTPLSQKKKIKISESLPTQTGRVPLHVLSPWQVWTESPCETDKHVKEQHTSIYSKNPKQIIHIRDNSGHLHLVRRVCVQSLNMEMRILVSISSGYICFFFLFALQTHSYWWLRSNHVIFCHAAVSQVVCWQSFVSQ